MIRNLLNARSAAQLVAGRVQRIQCSLRRWAYSL